jgi:hypothetical protein
MAERSFTNLRDFAAQLRKDVRARKKRLATAVRKTAKEGAKLTRQYVPKAFEELADSIHPFDIEPGHSEIVADAPHAAAVENGSAPHMPPLEPLILWVELRGVQGLTKTGNVASEHWLRNAKKSGYAVGAARTAQTIAKSLRGTLGRKGAAEWRARTEMGSLAAQELGHDPAVVAIARAIQMAIAKRGTKPRRYMQMAVPRTETLLGKYARAALPEQD